jgi:prepilin signal peptidase PulO-like enzyme (type II secretory pathway)
MELLTASVFAIAAVYIQTIPELLFTLVLCSVLIVIAAYDYRHMVIPDLMSLLVGMLGLLYVLMTSYQAHGYMPVSLAVLSSVGTAFFFWCLWFFSKGRWIGFGDVKLALALGLFLSPLGAFTMIVFSFWTGALISLMLLLIQYAARRGQKYLLFSPLPLTMKSEVPFAPFLIFAFLVVFLTGATLPDLASLFI